MRRITLIVGICLVLVVGFAAPAFAYDEPGGDLGGQHGTVRVECLPCHRPGPPNNSQCDMCHAPHMGSLGQAAGKGPHGLYSTTTDRCDACHDLHDAAGATLLPAATVAASCNTCHDGTGGHGVYGAIKAQTGADPAVSGAMHSIDTTSVVPGGNAGTGGSSTMVFKGVDSRLTCGDCHSPHDSNTVAPYTQERWRSTYTIIIPANRKTSKLLRQRPGDTATAVPVYGSDWCAACHAGRSSGGAVHNHPVDSTATTSTPFSYDSVARLDSDNPTGVTVLGTLAGTNRGYLMPFPRTSGAGGQGEHKPICQQCHEDTRSVGTLAGSTGDAASFSITATDGVTPTDNPRFQNFPHETQNPNMLVEQNDDLCLNCHPTAQLP